MASLTVAVVADYWPPASRGGAVRALSATVAALASDVRFHVVTRDHDALTGEALGVSGANRWVEESGIPILRLSRDRVRLGQIVDAMAEVRPRTVYANSLFSRLTQRLLLARRLSRLPQSRLVIAPEGELDPGALAIKPARKRAWLALARASGVLDGVLFKAASDMEAQAIRTVLPAARVQMVPHPLGSRSASSVIAHAPKCAGRLRLLFLSRIAPKKNLSFLLEVLRSVEAAAELTIVGPVDDQAEWNRCRRIIAALPQHVSVAYVGACAPEQVWRFYAEADAFVLPTLGENHGYVIEDALWAGCPPLISDRTPWSFLESRQAGFVVPLADEKGWRDTLAHLVAMDEPEHQALRRRCQTVASEAGGVKSTHDPLLRLLGGCTACRPVDAGL